MKLVNLFIWIILLILICGFVFAVTRDFGSIGANVTLGDSVFVDTTTGYVGIGTRTPMYLLDVSGLIRLSGESVLIFPDGTNISTGNVGSENCSVEGSCSSITYDSELAYVQNCSVSGSCSAVSYDTEVTAAILANNNTLSTAYVPYAGATDNIDLGANDLTVKTNVLFVDATDNKVGIGTTTPVEKLYVQGKSNGTDIEWALAVKNPYNAEVSDPYGVGIKLRTGAVGENTKWGGFAAVSESGYSNSQGLALYANEAERVRINNQGFVGIGTTTPNSTLEVHGDISSTTTGSMNYSRIVIDYSSPEGRIRSMNSAVSPASNLGLYTTDNGGSTNKVMHISYDGKVGVGTTSPDAKLNIVSSSDSEILINRSSGASLRLMADGSQGYIGTGTNHPLRFMIASSTKMLLDTDGDLGIGTNTPNSKLQVQGDTAPLFSINRTSGGNANMLFTNSDDDTGYYVGVSGTENFGIGRNVDLSQNNLLTITSSGRVGIGVTSPSNDLEVKNSFYVGNGTSGYMYIDGGSQSSSQLIFKNNSVSKARIGVPYNQNYLSLSGTDTLDAGHVVIIGSGYVGIGTKDPSYRLDVVENRVSGYIARFFNDGNENNRNGVIVQVGTDDNSGNNYHMTWRDGDGTNLGDIYSSGGNVEYSAFTGSHFAEIPEEHNLLGYEYGTLMCLESSTTDPATPKQSNYFVTPCNSSYQKKVFGIYSGKLEGDNSHSIQALGDGHILVTAQGGNIEIGDYLTSSDIVGYAMKQDDDLLHSYTIAKATDSVNWSDEENDTKLISCTYHAE